MVVQDYDEVLALWQTSEGVGLSDADSEESIGLYLARNPDISFVARDGEHLVGAVLCGHDGRRGYIHHLAVSESHRRQGLGRALVERCLSALRRAGIGKCHIFVFAANQDTIAFWKGIGWTQRVELVMMSQYTQQLLAKDPKSKAGGV
jgi:putative acetyltransferase